MKPALLLLFLIACLSLVAQDRHVVVISIDGFPAYALKDPSIPLPNIRRLAREGAVAESMQPVNPTVTWPNHTAIVTGITPSRHSVIYNGWAVKGAPGQPVKVEPHVEKAQLVQGVTLYDLAHQKGLTTAEVDWVAIEKAPTITWSFAEWASAAGPLEREMITAGALREEDLNDFTKAPITFRDEIWTQAGEYLLTHHKPNLLLFHLLTTDTAQHRYGARSLPAHMGFAMADAKVGRLVDACRRAGILDRTTFVIVSDHGFHTFQRVIRPNAIVKEAGLSGKAYVIPEGGTAMVYVTDPAGKQETIAALQKAFTGIEGINRVIAPADFASLGYPQPEKNARMSDLVLAAADTYAFEGAATGAAVGPVVAGTTPGSHGFLNTNPDMQAVFIASGAGIKPGTKLGAIRNLDVAPTIAGWLGLELRNVEGHALEGLHQ